MRVEANEHRHPLAGEVAAANPCDDEASFGHGKKRQLRDPNQPAHVPSARRRDRQRHFRPAPAMPAEVGHGYAVIAAIDRDGFEVANLLQHDAPHARTCAREVERGRARRRRDDAPFRSLWLRRPPRVTAQPLRLNGGVVAGLAVFGRVVIVAHG